VAGQRFMRTRIIMKLPLLAAFAILALSLFAQVSTELPAKTIPQISIYNINGKLAPLQSLTKNKVTFIDFWFIPCGACFIEMKMLHKLYSKYKDNPNITFITITLTDSAFVKPLIENRNTSANEIYDYFRTLSQLDTFKLPVYFIENGSSKMVSFKKENGIFHGHGESRIKNQSFYPTTVFGFSAYPTIFIFDKAGKAIYNKTGFTKTTGEQQQKNIETIINGLL
jgi:thiol-disulfide isomerase/thioredoxin